jgi:hypothetical protein
VFGISSFAQSPFASLAGIRFSFALNENVTSADLNSQQSAFLQSIAEPVTVDDIDATAGDFFGSVIENLNAADAATVLAGF